MHVQSRAAPPWSQSVRDIPWGSRQHTGSWTSLEEEPWPGWIRRPAAAECLPASLAVSHVMPQLPCRAGRPLCTHLMRPTMPKSMKPTRPSGSTSRLPAWTSVWWGSTGEGENEQPSGAVRCASRLWVCVWWAAEPSLGSCQLSDAGAPQADGRWGCASCWVRSACQRVTAPHENGVEGPNSALSPPLEPVLSAAPPLTGMEGLAAHD